MTAPPAYLAQFDADDADRLAKAPGTPPGTLALLAETDDLDVQEAVAQNPSTDPDALFRMMLASRKAEDEVIQDYAEGLARAQDTTAVHRDERRLRKLLVKHPNADGHVMAVASLDTVPEIRMIAAASPFTATEDLVELVERELVLLNECRDRLAVGRGKRSESLERLNRHLTVLGTAVGRLREDRGVDRFDMGNIVRAPSNRQEATARAQHPTTPVEELIELFHAPHAKTRLLVAARPDIPTSIATQWAFHEHHPTKSVMARNPKTSEAGLLHLLWVSRERQRESYATEDQVVIDRDVPREVAFREVIAQHPKAGSMVMASLAWDDHLALRLIAAQHPETPGDALVSLLNHEQDRLARRGSQRTETSLGIITRQDVIAAAEANLSTRRRRAA